MSSPSPSFEHVLHTRLRNLTPHQGSIEQTSQWALFFATQQQNVTAIVNAWLEELGRAPSPDKKLALLYLANHILQEGKRKGRLFGEEFSKVVPKGVRELLRSADPKTRSAVARVVRVWEERRVFGSSVIKALKEQLASAAAKDQGNGASMDEASRRKLQAVGSLGQLLADAAAAAAKSEHSTAKVQRLQPQIFQMGSMEEVSTAHSTLSSCLSVLEAEVQCRQRAAAELREQVVKQENGMRRAQQQLQQLEPQKAMADARMSALQQQQPQQPSQPPPLPGMPLPNGMPAPPPGMLGPPPHPHLAHLMMMQAASSHPLPPSSMPTGLPPPGMPAPLSHPLGAPPGMPFSSMPLPPPPQAMLLAMQQQQQQQQQQQPGSMPLPMPPLPPPHALAMMASAGFPPPHLPHQQHPPLSTPIPPMPGALPPHQQPPQAPGAQAPQPPHPHPSQPHPQPPQQQQQQQPPHSASSTPMPSQHPHPPQPQPPGPPQPPHEPSLPGMQCPTPQNPGGDGSTDSTTAEMFAKAFAEMPEEERQRLAAGMAAAVAHTSSTPPAMPPSGPPPPPQPSQPAPAPAPAPAPEPPSGMGGELGGGAGGGEDSLLADADFSRYILGEDPMGSQGNEYDPGGYGGLGEDDYDPANPF